MALVHDELRPGYDYEILQVKSTVGKQVVESGETKKLASRGRAVTIRLRSCPMGANAARRACGVVELSLELTQYSGIARPVPLRKDLSQEALGRSQSDHKKARPSAPEHPQSGKI